MPGASAGGYAANAGAVGAKMGLGIGTGTAAGSAAASSGASAASAGWFNPLYAFMGVQALGTAATAYSQSKAQKMEGDFQASMYESNARIQAIKAADAIARGDKEAVKAKEAAKRLIGSQRAAMGAQGIDLESGSALDIQEETASLGAEEALNIKNNAWREAWGYRAAGEEYSSRAAYSKLSSKNTSRNTILTGGLSIAKGLAYSQYLSKNKSSYASNLEDYMTGAY